MALISLSILLLFLLLSSPSFSLFLSSNSSLFAFPSSSPVPSPPSFLGEIVKAIAEKERWDPRGEVRVSDLDGGKARVGVLQRYEFKGKAGKTTLLLSFSDETVEWRRAAGGAPAVVESEMDLVAGEGLVGIGPAVRDLELTGPLDLRVDSEVDDEISLHLTALNITHTRLKRILVAEGITLKVVGAQEVSFIHPYDIGLTTNGSLVTHSEDDNQIWPLGYSSCAPLLSMHVKGSVMVVADRTRRSGAFLKASFESHDTVELLSEKCFVNGHGKRISRCLFCSVSPKLALVGTVVRTLLDKKALEDISIRFLQAKIVSSLLVKFQLKLEREITEDDRIWKNVSEWKMKPKIQHVWLQVVAKVEGGRLKVILVKKLKGGFYLSDSTAWSNLMSNVSFTQFPSFIVPPETLTLDVKW
ncbi:protein TUNICAMYCIN INDUCED 1 [Typha angustifolia]|uniref:protein TUNICAMYCIN INDUCED 1 n=1 Tax=Typha angustifolia TaxID=59011 RepID=UPI003C2DFCB5